MVALRSETPQGSSTLAPTSLRVVARMRHCLGQSRFQSHRGVTKPGRRTRFLLLPQRRDEPANLPGRPAPEGLVSAFTQPRHGRSRGHHRRRRAPPPPSLPRVALETAAAAWRGSQRPRPRTIPSLLQQPHGQPARALSNRQVPSPSSDTLQAVGEALFKMQIVLRLC